MYQKQDNAARTLLIERAKEQTVHVLVNFREPDASQFPIAVADV